MFATNNSCVIVTLPMNVDNPFAVSFPFKVVFPFKVEFPFKVVFPPMTKLFAEMSFITEEPLTFRFPLIKTSHILQLPAINILPFNDTSFTITLIYARFKNELP